MLGGIYAIIWQLTGVTVALTLLRKLSWLPPTDEPPTLALAIAWLLWLPFCGTVVLFLSIFAWISPAPLILAQALIMTSGIICLFRQRHELRLTIARYKKAWLPKTSRLFVPVFCVIGTLKFMEFYFSAVPKRLYDQLSYHLVIAKKVLTTHSLPFHEFDPHLIIAGPVEYAFIWPRALLNSDFFSLAAAPAWIFVVTVPLLIFSACRLSSSLPAKTRFYSLLTALTIFPAIIPNNEIVQISKPNGLLLAGGALCAMILVTRPDACVSIIIALSLALSACHQTFLHTSLAFGLLFLAFGKMRGQWRNVYRSKLVALGAFCLLIAIGKNYRLAECFFFPADAGIFNSPMSDSLLQKTWHQIAFGPDTMLLVRLLGAWYAPAENHGFVLWLGLCFFAFGAHQFMLRRDRLAFPFQPLQKGGALFAFIGFYIALWPLFYGSHIYSRFVASYLGAMIIAATWATASLPQRWQPLLVFLAITIGLSYSSADVLATKLFAASQQSLNAAFAAQFPRLATATWLNRYGPAEGLLLADDPAKLFFDLPVLHSTLSPHERQVWASFEEAPQETAKEQHLVALVMKTDHLQKTLGASHWDGDEALAADINRTWTSLEPFGRVVQFQYDTVLYSNCFFQSFPCGMQDAPWPLP